MRTVRRLYIYLVTLISLELVVWGLISLLQNSFSSLPGAETNLLASGLSLVLVGLPIFLLHGWIAQREARRDPEELSSRMRALFHYAARLALLSPVVVDLYNLNKAGLQAWFRIPSVALSTGSTPTDRLISIVINLLAWYVLDRLLRADWLSAPDKDALVEVRRLSRYVWMLFGLGLATSGMYQILQYLLDPTTSQFFGNAGGAVLLVNGLALTLVGVPLWVYCWDIVMRTKDLPGERPSFLRWVVLYTVALLAALVVLFTAQTALLVLIQSLLGANLAFTNVLSQMSQPLAASLTLGVVWAYFGRQVSQEWADEADEQRRAGLCRLYEYPLALLGNAVVFAGVWQVLGLIVELLLSAATWGDVSRQSLAGGIAWLAVGLPFWLTFWPRLQLEAHRSDDAGDHARRSVLRKTYLYLAVFLTVVGLMSSAGFFFYRLINALLGNAGENLALDSWQQVRSMALLAVWLGYHLSVLRADGRLALRALAERQSAFPVLVLQPAADPFYPALAESLQHQAPGLPVSVLALDEGLPGPMHLSARAVVLPAALALDPPAGLRDWLSGFTGRRVVVPLLAAGWAWASLPARAPRELAHDTALLLRQLAEGQSPRLGAPANPWVIAGYVFGGLFALLIGLVLIAAFFGGL
jgi:hypothetical protein